MSFALILDTAFHTGDLDGDYTHIIFSDVNMTDTSVSFKVDYGRLVSEVWTSGSQYKQKTEIYLNSTSYVSFLGTTSLGGKTLQEFMFDFFLTIAQGQIPSMTGTKVEY